MRISQWRGGAIISAIVAALMVVSLVAISLINAGIAPSVEAAMLDNDEASSVETEEEVTLEDLRVSRSDLLPEAARCESNVLNRNSINTEDHISSDAVSTAFDSNRPSKMFDELLEENCGNPTLLQMNIDGLLHTFDGIGELNPWMQEYLSAYQADHFSVLAKSGKDVIVTPNFTETAEMVNTILLRLKVRDDIVKSKTLSNWHIAADSGLAVGDKMPVATLNKKQYTGKFLVLEYTLKGQDCPAYVIGFNTGDKRFAELPKNCDKPPKDNPPPPPPKDGEVTVCIIKGKGKGTFDTIKKSKFNSEIHSKNLNHPACKTEPPKEKDLKVCVISGDGKGKIRTIKEGSFDPKKHSKNLNHPACKTEPPKEKDLKVCVISGKDKGKIIPIKESAFNSKKHSKNLKDARCNPKDDEGPGGPPGKPPAPSPTDPPEDKPPVVEDPIEDKKPGDDPKPTPRPSLPPKEDDGGEEEVGGF